MSYEIIESNGKYLWSVYHQTDNARHELACGESATRADAESDAIDAMHEARATGI